MFQQPSSLVGLLTSVAVYFLLFQIFKVSKPAGKVVRGLWAVALISAEVAFCTLMLLYGELTYITVVTILSTGCVAGLTAIVGYRQLTVENGEGFFQIFEKVQAKGGPWVDLPLLFVKFALNLLIWGWIISIICLCLDLWVYKRNPNRFKIAMYTDGGKRG